MKSFLILTHFLVFSCGEATPMQKLRAFSMNFCLSHDELDYMLFDKNDFIIYCKDGTTVFGNLDKPETYADCYKD